jgi:glycosyltransferase involved in cell wall biosynthesis
MSKQKVLFDAGPVMDVKKTGVGYYVSHLVGSLQQEHAGELELVGYYFDFLNRHHKQPPDGPIRFHKIWLIPGKLLSLCRRLRFQPFLEIFVRQRSDAIIFTNYVSLPQLRRRKTALVLYDMSFLDVPEYTQSVNLAYLKRFCPPSIRRADVIITISEFTKQRLEHHFPDLKADIVVTPIPPAGEALRVRGWPESLEQKGIKAGQYILYVGTIEPRKNLTGLIEAYAGLPEDLRKQHSLVLAGGKGWKDEETLLAAADAQSQGLDVILTGYVSDEEKAALYAKAACFVLPSHYEGFGMPLFEAMQYGTPTAASDIPVFHEVAGDASLYFDKDKPADIAAAIASILTDEQLAKDLAAKGTARLKAFSWRENAAKVYESLR